MRKGKDCYTIQYDRHIMQRMMSYMSCDTPSTPKVYIEKD